MAKKRAPGIDAVLTVEVSHPGIMEPDIFSVKVANAKGQIPLSAQNTDLYRNAVIKGLREVFGRNVL